MNAEDWTELDELVAHDSPDADDVLDAMEAVTERPDGLSQLVDRYAASPSAIVTRALSFLLAQAASSARGAQRELVYRFIERLTVSDDPSTLMNTLTAVQRQAIAGAPWGDGSTATRLLPPLIMRSLKGNPLVQSTALRLLARLYEDGLLPSLFAGDAAAATLRRHLAGIEQTELVASSFGELARYVAGR